MLVRFDTNDLKIVNGVVGRRERRNRVCVYVKSSISAGDMANKHFVKIVFECKTNIITVDFISSA